MSESPNAVACPECSSLEQTVEPNIPTAVSEGQAITETCQHTETPAPTSQAAGDAEKIAAGIEAQREAEAHRSGEEITPNATQPSSGNSESGPTAPPSVRADVQPPAYAPKFRVKAHRWHSWHLPRLNIRCPSDLTMIKFLFVLNNLLLLGTIATIIILLILALDEKDEEKKRLRFALVLAEAGYIFFYFRDCWTLACKYTNYWKHIECRHCRRMTQPNATIHTTV